MKLKKNVQSDSIDHGFQHKKSLGQNFLTSDVVPKWMCNAANLTAHDIVVEIGPGTGRLTTELLKQVKRVIAIETDTRAITALQETFSASITSGQLALIKADIKDFDITSLKLKAGEYKLVANIPYFLSGLLLRKFLEHPCHPSTLVFLMQKELVARIARDPKESLLSLGVKAFGMPTYIRTVSRGHFYPIPNVDSAILAVQNISHQNFLNQATREQFFSLLHLGFGQKRKQLISNLSVVHPRDKIENTLYQLHLPLTIRAEDMSVEDWFKLYTNIST